ncbi:hypothetical protein EJB05_43996, partial [Eragrostis curvula]
MAPAVTSAVALVTTAAVALALAASQPIGLPGCNTTCGDVSVPYPFGFGPPHCYWHGFNLTCDGTSSATPRLLLGDGTLRVTKISLRNATVRVMRTGSILNTTGEVVIGDAGWNVTFGSSFRDHGYLLSSRNELVVSGCNVVATLLAEVGERTPRIISGCATFCTIGDGGHDIGPKRDLVATTGKHCTGTSRCCQAPLSLTSPPTEVQVRWLCTGNHTGEQELAPVNVFVAEEGWVDRTGLVGAKELQEAPLVLRWMVTKELPPRNRCADDVRRKLCKSQNSECRAEQPAGYTCICQSGYDGNPYIDGGCRAVDLFACSLQTSMSAKTNSLMGALANVPIRSGGTIANARKEHKATTLYPMAVYQSPWTNLSQKVSPPQ